MAETSTIFGFMKYVSATDILSNFKKTVDSHFVNSLRRRVNTSSFIFYKFLIISSVNASVEALPPRSKVNTFLSSNVLFNAFRIFVATLS